MITHPVLDREVDLDAAMEYDMDAMVSCTPLKGAKPVLPTKQVPYANRMVWQWHLESDTYVNACLVVAKIEHHFSLTAMPSKAGDTIELVLLASDLEHHHGN